MPNRSIPWIYPSDERIEDDWRMIVMVFDLLWPHQRAIVERLEPWLEGNITLGEMGSLPEPVPGCLKLQSYCGIWLSADC
jgi:hypothetical protein